MGRACNCALTTFRVIQLILSLVALSCGIYIAYTMYSIASTATDLETGINMLHNGTIDVLRFIDDAHAAENIDEVIIDPLVNVLVPVIKYLEETPTRAIVIAAVGLWSVMTIAYLFFARRRKSHTITNRRAIRVPLEVVTLLAWVASLVCGVLLALEYSMISLSGGIAVKVALKVARKALQAALERVVKTQAHSAGDDFEEALNIMGDIVTVGILAVVSVAASSICGAVSFVSLIVACCMSGKQKEAHAHGRSLDEKYEHGTPMSAQPLNGGFYDKNPVGLVAEVAPAWQSPYTPATPFTPYTPASPYTPRASHTEFASTKYRPIH